MGKCSLCGKWSLFLKTDGSGRCEDCLEEIKRKEDEEKIKKAEEIKREEVNKFKIYYSNVLSHLKNIQEVIKVGNNPTLALEFIPILEDKIRVCDTLKSEIHNPQYEKDFIEKLIKNITYRDDFCKRHGMGKIEEFGISVYRSISTNQFSKEEILSEIDKKIDSYKRELIGKVESIQDNAEFQKRIDCIPSVDVKTSNTNYKKLNVSELDGVIKYSNITSKTSFDKIGSFVVVDAETTGLSSTKDRLVEVAAVKFEDWTPVEKFHTLLNPGKHIPEDASEINNITDDMVVDSPSFSQIIDSLETFIGKYNIVGHNLPFDLKFLYKNGYNFTSKKRRYFDTYEIANKILKKPKMKWDKELYDYVINDNYDYDVEDYKLVTLCDYYGIRDNLFSHRAVSDAFATGLLFECLAKQKIDY